LISTNLLTGCVGEFELEWHEIFSDPHVWDGDPEGDRDGDVRERPPHGVLRRLVAALAGADRAATEPAALHPHRREAPRHPH